MPTQCFLEKPQAATRAGSAHREPDETLPVLLYFHIHSKGELGHTLCHILVCKEENVKKEKISRKYLMCKDMDTSYSHDGRW